MGTETNDLIPRGRPGRGTPPPWTPRHHANVIMAFGAPSPIDSAEAVNKLRPLKAQGHEEGIPQGSSQGRLTEYRTSLIDLTGYAHRRETLGEWLERMIGWLSDREVRAG